MRSSSPPLHRPRPAPSLPTGRRRGSVAPAPQSAQSAALYAEFRRLSVLFVSLTDLALEAKRLQAVATALFDLSDTYGGHVLKFIFDDKGVVVIIAHGLVATEDDGLHAVLNGLDIAREMGNLGVSACIGISTGDVFCGLVGAAAHLRQFDIFSSSVNLAARLMSKGSSYARPREGVVLIDSATLDVTMNQIDAEYMGLVPLKGKAEPVAVYQVKKQKKTSLRSTASAMTSGLVGRLEERRILADAVQDLALRSGDNPEAASDSGGETEGAQTEAEPEPEAEAEAEEGAGEPERPPSPVTALVIASAAASRTASAAAASPPNFARRSSQEGNGFHTPRALAGGGGGGGGGEAGGTGSAGGAGEGRRLARAHSGRRASGGHRRAGSRSESRRGSLGPGRPVILIEGETTLVGYALEQAEDTGVDLIAAGQGLAHRRTVAYHAIAPVLQTLLEDFVADAAAEAAAAGAAARSPGASMRHRGTEGGDASGDEAAQAAIARTVAAIGFAPPLLPAAGAGPSRTNSANDLEGLVSLHSRSVRSAQSTGLMQSLSRPRPARAPSSSAPPPPATPPPPPPPRAALGPAGPHGHARSVSPRVEWQPGTPNHETASPRFLRHASTRVSVTSTNFGARMSVRHSSAAPSFGTPPAFGGGGGPNANSSSPAAAALAGPPAAAVHAAILAALAPEERRAMHLLVEVLPPRARPASPRPAPLTAPQLLSTSEIGLSHLSGGEHSTAAGAGAGAGAGDSAPHSAAASMKHASVAGAAASQGRPAASSGPRGMATVTGSGGPSKSAPGFNSTLAAIAAALGAAARAEEASASDSASGAALRAQAVEALVVSLVRRLAARKTALLVLEELHAFDSRSLALLAALVEGAPPSGLLLVATSRPLPEGDSSAGLYAAIAQSASTRLVRLGPLGPEDAAPLVARALGVRRRFLPKALADFIYAKSAGQPHFTVELAQSIARMPGVLEVANGRCTILQPLTNITVPDNLKGALTSKVDRLPPVLAYALKVASVLGQRFRASALASLQRSAAGGGFSDAPADDQGGYDEAQVDEILEGLVQAGCLQDISSEGLDDGPGMVGAGAAFEFSSALLVEVAYGLLSPSMRRVLHAAAARYIEGAVLAAAQAAQGASPAWDAWARAAGARALPGGSRHPHLYPLLSYHYHLAEEYPRAIGYLEKEGEHAIATHSSAEVLRIYTTIMELADALSRGIGDPDGDEGGETDRGPGVPRTSSTEPVVSKPQSRNQSRRRLPSGLQTALVPLNALAKAAAEAAGGVGGGERRASMPALVPEALLSSAVPGRGLGPAWRLRSARWLRFLATAQADLGLFEAAEASLCRALELLGRPVPPSPLRLRLAAALGGLRQRLRHAFAPLHRRRAGALLEAGRPAPPELPEPPAAARDDPFWLVSLGGPEAAAWERAAVLGEAAAVHERRCAGLAASGSALQLRHAVVAGANAAEDALAAAAAALHAAARRPPEPGASRSGAEALAAPPLRRGRRARAGR
eukprot:tig00020816_g14106.t1